MFKKKTRNQALGNPEVFQSKGRTEAKNLRQYTDEAKMHKIHFGTQQINIEKLKVSRLFTLFPYVLTPPPPPPYSRKSSYTKIPYSPPPQKKSRPLLSLTISARYQPGVYQKVKE